MPIANEFESLQDVDALVHRFESAWHEGKSPPDIDDFLPRDNSLRLKTLIELVHIDLERRLVAHLPANVEDYLKRYPELAAYSEVVEDLVNSECDLRRPANAKPSRRTGPWRAGRAAGAGLPPLLAKDDPGGLTPPFVLGPYRIVARVGKGGMGVVFRAVHAHLQKQVAIKILLPGSMSDPKAVVRFRREMAAIGRLDHHNIVRATDGGEVDGVHFLAMDFIDGINLGHLVSMHGRLSVAEACDLVCQAADGLQCAQEHGLVHRDIKPSNLVLSAKGDLKILDLGLALLHHGESAVDALTARGQAMGTYDYMAPEQWQSSHEVDGRADIYSLGCTLYTLLIGRPPFSGPDYDSAARKMAAHLGEPVKSVMEQRPDVPLAVDKLLRRMVAKDPADRPSTPDEVAAALEPFRHGADLAQLARQAMARRDSGELEEPDQLLSEAVTVCRATTDGESTLARPSAQRNTRRFRRTLRAAGFLAPTALALALVIQPWSGGVPRGDDRAPTQKQSSPETVEQIVSPRDFAAGQWHDLLDRPPTELVWNPDGMPWMYDKQKLIKANCDECGLLQLGTVPNVKRYELEVDIFYKSWIGAAGLFFRGRREDGDSKTRIRTETLSLSCPRAAAPSLTWANVDAFAELHSTTLSPRRVVPVTTPQQGKIRWRVVVGPEGLERAFWDDKPLDAKLSTPEPNHVPRSGTEGSFGIYLANTDVVVSSARIFIHP